MKSKYCKVNFQKARDACTITCLRSKPCKGWQPESDQKQGFRSLGLSLHLPSLLQCTWQLASAYIPSWPSSTALVSRGLTLLLSFSFRNPRERLWLAQFGSYVHLVPVSSQGVGSCSMKMTIRANPLDWELIRRKRAGVSGPHTPKHPY